METRQRQAILRWLEAERRGDDAVAERALGGLWRRLGRPSPTPGFARRTLARAGLAPLAVRRRAPVLPGPVWLPRAALAAALALVAVSVSLAPLSLVALAAAGDRLLGGAISLVPTLSERLAHGLTAWSVATRISGSLLAGLAEPPVLAVLAVSFLMSLFAFGWLRQLLSLERSPSHA